MSRPLILITNDDGIYSSGIKQLWKSIHPFADVIIVAPATEQSGVSMSLTLRQPVSYEKIEWFDNKTHACALRGTPADCVKIATNIIMPRKPDLIVSGINKGNNAGRNVFYSGTVGAVMEGIMQEIPGIAFSIDDEFNPQYLHLEAYIPQIVKYTLNNTLPHGTFLNVNFPKDEIKGIKFARQGREYWREDPQERLHPAEGKPYYWLGRKFAPCIEEENSDIMWLRKGYAAVVPIHIGNLTNDVLLSSEKDRFHQYIDQSDKRHQGQ